MGINKFVSIEKLLSREFFQGSLVYFLIFLYPIAGMLFRGWNSYIFTIFILLALLFYKRRDVSISREEGVLLWIAVLAFISFQISSMHNGWNVQSTKAIGMALRIFLFVPFYYLIRPLEDTGKWLLWGVFAGALVLGGQALYELLYLNNAKVKGAYFHLIFGGYSVLYAFLLIVSFNMLSNHSRLRQLALLIAITAALLGLAASGARGSYIVVPALIVMIVLLKFRNKIGMSILLLSVISVYLAYQFSPIVNYRVNDAISEVRVYMESDVDYNSDINANNKDIINNSQAQRFEMWRTAWMIFKDNPIVGIGQKNYHKEALKYVDQGLVDPVAARAGHPHNVYLEFLASTGIIGFLMMMALHFYPAVVFLKTYKKSSETALIGLVFIVTYAVLGLTEASTLTKGNYLSTFLVFLAVFFSWHIKEVNKADRSN